MFLALILAAQVAATPTPTPGYRATVVLVDGTRYTVAAPYNPHDRLVMLRLVGGKTIYVAPGDLDQPATKAANAPPVTPTAVAASTPRPKGAGTFSATESTAPGATTSITLGPSGAVSSSKPKTVHVDAYTKKDGTNVDAHTRSAPSPKKN